MGVITNNVCVCCCRERPMCGSSPCSVTLGFPCQHSESMPAWAWISGLSLVFPREQWLLCCLSGWSVTSGRGRASKTSLSLALSFSSSHSLSLALYDSFSLTISLTLSFSFSLLSFSIPFCRLWVYRLIFNQLLIAWEVTCRYPHQHVTIKKSSEID